LSFNVVSASWIGGVFVSRGASASASQLWLGRKAKRSDRDEGHNNTFGNEKKQQNKNKQHKVQYPLMFVGEGPLFWRFGSVSVE
jgi:hypothetical protein